MYNNRANEYRSPQRFPPPFSMPDADMSAPPFVPGPENSGRFWLPMNGAAMRASPGQRFGGNYGSPENFRPQFVRTPYSSSPYSRPYSSSPYNRGYSPRQDSFNSSNMSTPNSNRGRTRRDFQNQAIQTWNEEGLTYGLMSAKPKADSEDALVWLNQSPNDRLDQNPGGVSDIQHYYNPSMSQDPWSNMTPVQAP